MCNINARQARAKAVGSVSTPCRLDTLGRGPRRGDARGRDARRGRAARGRAVRVARDGGARRARARARRRGGRRARAARLGVDEGDAAGHGEAGGGEHAEHALDRREVLRHRVLERAVAVHGAALGARHGVAGEVVHHVVPPRDRPTARLARLLATRRARRRHGRRRAGGRRRARAVARGEDGVQVAPRRGRVRQRLRQVRVLARL